MLSLSKFTLSRCWCAFFVFFIAVMMPAVGISASRHYQTLSDSLSAYISSYDADIGVAVIIDDSDTITAGVTGRCQLNSVMKLYQAVAVCHHMAAYSLPLFTHVCVNASDLSPSTWSPLRDQRLKECPFEISVAELLRYSLRQSDNNACDILFDRADSPSQTDSLLRHLGLTDFSIRWNEAEMHNEPIRSYDNWTTPLQAASLINLIFKTDIVPPSYRQFITSTLVGCKTGDNRLNRPLKATNAIIGHKTGTGFEDNAGNPQGINDVGFVILPNGHSYAIAVFVNRTTLPLEQTENIIGDISEMVYHAICR